MCRRLVGKISRRVVMKDRGGPPGLWKTVGSSPVPRPDGRGYFLPALRASVLCGVVACATGSVDLAWGQPSVVKLQPGSVVPGKTTEISLQGTKLDGPLG